MDRQYKLSNVTKDYLNVFHNILDKMIKDMTEAKLTYSISHNFIVQMIPHHRAAIEMSENILKYTTNLTLQNIAANIIKEQTKSIANMEKILNSCSELINSDNDVYLYQRRVDNILKTMFSGMENAYTTNEINCDFMREMIPHHKGAVEMSKNVLQYDICPDLKPILYAIISSQEKGIAEMQRLLRRIGC